MKKMLVLTLMLSAMAMGSAMANDATVAEVRGPKRININIVVPLRHGVECNDPHHRPHHKRDCNIHHKPHHKPHNHGSGFRSHKPHNHSDKAYRPGHGRPSRPAYGHGALGRGNSSYRGSYRK